MRKRIQKKSEVLREGYVKGLRKAQRIISEMLQTADGRTIQDDARVWVDLFNTSCVWNGMKPTLSVIYDNYDTFEVLSVKYDKEGNKFVFQVNMDDRTARFFINDARNVIYESEVSDIPAASVEVEMRSGHGAQPLTDVFEGAEAISLYDCPRFSDAFPRYGSNF